VDAPTLVDVPTLVRTVPVAASTRLSAWLNGGVVAGHVAVTGRYAAYLRTPRGPLAVVATDAVAPSTALVLPVGVKPDDVLPTGCLVRLGEGAVVADHPVGARPPRSVVLRPARWSEPARVRSGALDVDALGVLAGAVAARATDASPEVVHARAAAGRGAQALVAGMAGRALAHLQSVLGLGPGTTPSGDDATAGALLAAHALLPGARRRAELRRVGAALVAHARASTGVVSLLMLTEASDGCGPGVVVRAIDALTGHGDPFAAAMDVLGLGHHSGADIASGAIALAQAVERQNPVR